jgi:hypothetical protein
MRGGELHRETGRQESDRGAGGRGC